MPKIPQYKEANEKPSNFIDNSEKLQNILLNKIHTSLDVARDAQRSEYNSQLYVSQANEQE